MVAVVVVVVLVTSSMSPYGDGRFTPSRSMTESRAVFGTGPLCVSGRAPVIATGAAGVDSLSHDHHWCSRPPIVFKKTAGHPLPCQRSASAVNFSIDSAQLTGGGRQAAHCIEELPPLHTRVDRRPCPPTPETSAVARRKPPSSACTRSAPGWVAGGRLGPRIHENARDKPPRARRPAVALTLAATRTAAFSSAVTILRSGPCRIPRSVSRSFC